MRSIFSSRALLLCAAIFAMALAACAPIFDAARDAAQSMGSPTPNPHVVSERDVTARVLDRRFRDELRKGDPAVKLGHVSCPAADFIEAVETCTIRVDGVTIPILAQLDVPDKHVDASLGISRVGRGALERDIAVQIESEYGESSKVHCPIPAVIWSIPQKVIACTVDGAPSVGPQVSVQFLDSNRWVVIYAKAEPPDERRVLNADVAGVLRHRFAVAVRLVQGPYGVDEISCPKVMDLRPGHDGICNVKFDGIHGRERVRFIRDRLAYRVDGAEVDLDKIRSYFIASLKGRYKTPRNVEVSIDCSADHVVLVQQDGWHWCEINGPAAYPRRLVITALDRDGHFDVFTSNFSQSAWQH